MSGARTDLAFGWTVPVIVRRGDDGATVGETADHIHIKAHEKGCDGLQPSPCRLSLGLLFAVDFGTLDALGEKSLDVPPFQRLLLQQGGGHPRDCTPAFL